MLTGPLQGNYYFQTLSICKIQSTKPLKFKGEMEMKFLSFPHRVSAVSRCTVIRTLSRLTWYLSAFYSKPKLKSTMRTIGRGALIVLEGCDRVGKSTQVRMLEDALTNKCNLSAESRQFPNRKSETGNLIDKYLQRILQLPKESIVLLFSANRWECKDSMIQVLESGTSIIIDRYAASGAAYGAVNTGRDLDWCKQLDKGLPAPDLVILLKVDKETLEQRNGWGEERFENKQFQEKVAENFLRLADDTWKTIENKDIDTTHAEVLEAVVDTIARVKHSPIKTLYGL